MKIFTAKELQQRMLAHIEMVRRLQVEERGETASSVLRHLKGEDLLRVDQFVRSFRTE